MPATKDSARFEIEHLWVLTALFLIGGYVYAQFLDLPYVGFTWTSANGGRVRDVYAPGNLQPSDHLIEINSIPVADLVTNWWLSPLNGIQPGDVIPLRIERGGQKLTINWVVPGLNPEEFRTRLTNQWWLAFLFWAFGLCTLLFVRPKDTRWRLLLAFNLLTSVWLAASGTSRWHLFGSIYTMSGAMWLCLPVYVHLHWEFPQPLRRLPAWFWRLFYLASLALCFANWLLLLPADSYLLSVAAGSLISLALLGARFFSRPDQRRVTRLLLLGGGFTFIPPIIFGIVYSIFNLAPEGLLFTLLGLPILPLAYFYTARLGQFGAFELRANRIFNSYLFFFLLTALAATPASLVLQAYGGAGTAALPIVAIVLAASLLAGFGLRPFHRWMDRRILGLAATPESLIETYTRHITTRLDLPGIASVLDGQVLSSLLVRQSALARRAGDALQPVYLRGVTVDQLPAPADLPALLAQGGRLRAPDERAQCCSWVCVALPVTIEDRLLAVWLLGRRDPDDFYGQIEIDTLKLLAGQTAIALTNIAQADSLRQLHLANVNRHEMEQISMAHELHDDVLGALAALSRQSLSEAEHAEYEATVARIRSYIASLRPAMLEYGLAAGLQSLVDEMEDRYESDCPNIAVEVDGEGAQHDPVTAQHIYRIVQQACHNAIKHGRPSQISIRGRATASEIELIVEDDGRGFELSQPLDLGQLVANKHFGIAGMMERAAIVGAQLRIHSAPGRGARIALHLKTD